MSFGSQRVGRRQASERSAAVRIARRLLVTGGCAVAGWIGASAIGGAAHAATPQDAAPLTSVLHSVDGTHQLDGATSPVSGLSESVRHAVTQVVQSRRTASITVRSAEPAANQSGLPAAPSPTQHSADSTGGDLGTTLDSTDISDQLQHRLGAAGKSVSQLSDATKPVAQQVVAPITDTTQRATAPLTDPTTEVAKPIQSVTQTLAGKTPDLSNVTAPVTSTVHRVVSTVHHAVQPAAPALSLPGLSAPAGEQLGPVTVGTSPLMPTAGTTPVVRSAAARSAGHSRAAHHTAAAVHRGVRGERAAAASTSAGPTRATAELTAPIAISVRTMHADHALPHRQPVSPIAPLAPPAPAGGVGNGSGSGANANTSGSAGSSSPAALDADADAPVRTLGTVDPTDASMARSVSKRPSTSPD